MQLFFIHSLFLCKVLVIPHGMTTFANVIEVTVVYCALQYCTRFRFSQFKMQRSKRKMSQLVRRARDFCTEYASLLLAFAVVEDDLKS